MEVRVLSCAQMEYLYHGSTVENLKRLEPRKRFTPGEKVENAYVYATPVAAFAAVHAFPWSSEEGFDIAIEDTKITFIVPIAHKERLNVPISIYTLAAGGFEKMKEEETGLTWCTSLPVAVLDEKKYATVVQAIKSCGGGVRYS